jgi:hypothetical protein
MVRTWTLSTLHQRSLYFPNKRLSADTIRRKGFGKGWCYASSDDGDSGVGRDDADCVVMVVVMIIKVVTVVLKLGALTESPIHPHLATHRLAPSIPAPPTIYT